MLGFFPFGEGGPAAERGETRARRPHSLQPFGRAGIRRATRSAPPGSDKCSNSSSQLRGEAGARQVRTRADRPGRERRRLARRRGGRRRDHAAEARGDEPRQPRSTLSARAAFPDRPAVSRSATGRSTTMPPMARWPRGWPAVWRRAGLAPGDRVVLAMTNNPEYLADPVRDSGAPVWSRCPSTPSCTRARSRSSPPIAARKSVHRDAGPRRRARAGAGAADAARRARRRGLARAAPPPTPPPIAERRGEDLAWIFYTSGTTGRPKGAMLSHRNLHDDGGAAISPTSTALTPDDTHFHLAAQSHATGLFGLSHIAKATHQVLPPSGGFDRRRNSPTCCGSHRNATFFVPPTGLRRLLRDPGFAGAPIEHIRTVLLGAAPVYAADLKAGLRSARRRGCGTATARARAPAPSPRCRRPCWPPRSPRATRRAWSRVGIARTGIEVAIVDAEDRPLGPGEVGEVVVRGDTVMSGYWNLPEASAAALRGGWLHTGDLGALDARRLSDAARPRQGPRSSPADRTSIRARSRTCCSSIPIVAEVAVIGVPDPEWGESVMAAARRRPGRGLDLAELEALCLRADRAIQAPKALARRR